MKRIYGILLTGIFLINSCNASTGITLSHAWARPAAKDGNGAIYFLLQNHAVSADELMGVSSDIAETVEMHESKMEGDVMQMQQVTSLPIEAKASIEFAPGGYHVMLIGLNQDLKIGDEIQVTLHFKINEDLTVSVPVQENADSNSMQGH